ncbi:MAG TPA: hypothetical protein VH394_24500 [Thermoanaerobaculia bacterium]|jgi:hypothetical protein|nr:hypothetical protein [Thermoanaerobaculia bacterium]
MRKPLAFAVCLLSALAGPAWPQGPICEPPYIPEPADPYVFILLDMSSSMGDTTSACASAECATSMQTDHPDSKWIQTRQALYNILSNLYNVNLGFATFSNMSPEAVRAKHWLYQAATAGPVIPGSSAFPAVGSQEVFGLTWQCSSGASDGCSVSVPADLNDTWEVTRVRRLPKGGDAFNQTIDVYLRVGASTVYRVRYTPVSGGTLGGPIQTTVNTVRCTNSTCSTFSVIGTQTVAWNPVGDFISWENPNNVVTRTQPYAYFNPSASNDTFGGVCPSGGPPRWEPNSDDDQDTYTQSAGLSYNLKQPTDASDPRGEFFTVGDVIPLDWNNPHREQILARLAPNLAVDPFAAPDFRTAAYFQDHPAPGELFLRLKNESMRPLVPFGTSALGWSLRSFRYWFDGCTGTSCTTTTGWNEVAADLDPLWGCRKSHLLLITDSADECSPQGACAEVSALRSRTGMTTSVIALGQAPTDSFFSCLVQNGRGAGYFPRSQAEIENALTDFFTNVVGVQP